jgi:phage terminase large subunit-like protein
VDPVGVYNEVCTVTRHKTARMMRDGIPSRVVISSTPEPSEIFRRILEDRDSLVVTRMSSFENAAHLDASTVKFYRRMLSTALGRQEFLGELTFDLIAKGLFSSVDWLKATVDLAAAPARYERIVIGYDPIQGGVSGKVDEAGIFVVGLATAPDGLIHGYLLQDASLKSSQPKEVASKVVEVYRHWMGFADKCHVMVETNKGGQTSVDLLKMLEPKTRTEAVLARESKTVRATPLAALLEAGLVHIVGSPAKFKPFIDQAKDFTGEDNKTDGRVDSAAWPVWQYVWKSMKNRGAIQKLETPAPVVA